MAEHVREIMKFNLTSCKTGIVFNQTVVRCSRDIAELLKQIHTKEGNDFQEFFYCLFLNRRNQITGYYLASIGGMCDTIADPRIIIKAAALANCCCLILCHNHPSGSLKPSQADEMLTHKIKEACKWFDIKVIDHVILSEEGYYSFADEGII